MHSQTFVFSENLKRKVELWKNGPKCFDHSEPIICHLRSGWTRTGARVSKKERLFSKRSLPHFHSDFFKKYYQCIEDAKKRLNQSDATLSKKDLNCCILKYTHECYHDYCADLTDDKESVACYRNEPMRSLGGGPGGGGGGMTPGCDRYISACTSMLSQTWLQVVLAIILGVIVLLCLCCVCNQLRRKRKSDGGSSKKSHSKSGKSKSKSSKAGSSAAGGSNYSRSSHSSKSSKSKKSMSKRSSKVSGSSKKSKKGWHDSSPLPDSIREFDFALFWCLFVCSFNGLNDFD